MNTSEREAEGIDLYVRHLEAQAIGDRAEARRLLAASVALGEPMALHAAAFREPKVEAAVRLYERAAEAGFAASAWNLYLHYKERGEMDAARLWLERAARLGDEDAARLTGEPR